MNARCQKYYVLAVVAWAIVVAAFLWMPTHYLLPPAGAAHHDIRLLITLLVTLFVLLAGWAGFRSICTFFHAEQ